MLLKCLGSSSSGNCYLLDNGKEVLILDCGIDIRKIKKGLNWDISRIVSVLCTHAHKDHSLSAKEFKQMGIDVWRPCEQAIKKPQTRHFATFKVTALPMLDKDMEVWQHTNAKDLLQCPIYGFLIEVEKEGEKLLYVTDCKQCVWNFKKQKINHILLGIDFQNELLSDDEVKRRHCLTGHMSLSTGCDMIKTNATDSLRTVILCHMSDNSSDKEEMVKEVQKVAGNANVSVAEKGKCWELNLFPF